MNEHAGRDHGSTMNIPVTVVIPVKNEEQNLPSCLDRLSRFAEVIVVDSASADDTPDIVRRFGARLLQFEWSGGYPKKRNWVLLTQKLSTKWVLFLDADELVNEDFCKEVDAAILSGHHAGFWLNYKNHFLDRTLNYGVPQKKLALFTVGSGLYERIDEKSWSPLDMEIHEHPIIAGSIGEIAAPLDHRDYRGIQKFLDRHREYAVWEANRLLLFERERASGSTSLTHRQQVKYANIESWWFPWIYFTYTYILKLGFLDGAAGFHYAFYKAWYFSTIRLMVKELRQKPAQVSLSRAPSA